MRKFLRLSYDGSAYHGWQRQPGDMSVQQALEEALGTLLRVPVPVCGAGRTDTGVHARVMYAHFDTDREIENRASFLNGLNRLCGRDIAVYDIIDVADNAHARFDATSRSYRYFVTLGKSPFLSGRSWQSPGSLDMEKMNEAASILMETDDFTSFAKLHSDARTNICDVTEAVWEPWKNGLGVPGLQFRITADRFLRNMVRAVVGTLVDVGRGKVSVAGFKDIIERKDRCAAGTSMPAQALFLWDITYPYIPHIPSHEQN